MNSKTLSILCDPATKDPLSRSHKRQKEELINEKSGKTYPIRHGIPVFISDADVTGLNRKYRDLYDRLAFLYDSTSIRASHIYNKCSDIELRRRYLNEQLADNGALNIKDTDKMLEVSIGTGLNILSMPDIGRYYGIDISWGMLTRCKRNMTRAGRSAELFLGNAEYLPFIDNVFDIVFHVEGINFFNDKARAIREMIRVAKPGAAIVIIDMTEKLVKSLSNFSVARLFYDGMEKMAYAPVELVPDDMQNVKVDYFNNGLLYNLHFIKPYRALFY